tara:strand:+ start:5527 stop:5976 length:450 start_codon:yes stop_codon:yes gene_type:complete
LLLIPQILLFGITAYQDFKDRAISWYLPLLIFSVGLIGDFVKGSVLWKDYIASLCFVTLQITLLYGYLAIKKKAIKINLTGDFLGWGDLLFFVAVIPYFTFKEYAVLLITGMFLSLLAQKVIELFYRSDSIPLAGWLSIFYGIYMLITL